MRQRELEIVLRQIKEIVDKALETNSGRSAAYTKSKALVAPRVNASLPDHILGLRGKGFFIQSRTITEIWQKLQPTYPCDRDRITTAVRRLIKRNDLRKTSKNENGERVDAFVA